MLRKLLDTGVFHLEAEEFWDNLADDQGHDGDDVNDGDGALFDGDGLSFDFPCLVAG